MADLHATIPPGSNLTDRQLDDLRRIFRKFDTNNDGIICKNEMMQAVRDVSFRSSHDSEAVAMEILSQTDENKDDEVCFQEFVNAAVYRTSATGHSTSTFRNLIKAVALYYVKENDVKRKDYLDHYTFCPPPVFLIIMTIIQIIVYIVFAARECGGSSNLECPISFSSELAFRPGCREEVYRFLTYIFVHAGVSHILFNCILQVIVGMPLELVHGPLRIMGLYLLGGLAGSMASSVVDPNSNLVGASAAVYALVGAHVADTFLNWGEMPCRWIRTGILTVLIGADLALSIYNRYFNDDAPNISYSGHFAGFMLGCTLGTVILKNLEGYHHEKIVGYIGIALATGGFVFAFFWNIFYDFQQSSCPKL